MAVQWTPSASCFPVVFHPNVIRPKQTHLPLRTSGSSLKLRVLSALDPNNNGGGGSSNNHNFSSDNPNSSPTSKSNRKGSPSSPSSNYVVPLDKSSCITRPLAEILRDLNKRIPDNIIDRDHHPTFISWYSQPLSDC